MKRLRPAISVLLAVLLAAAPGCNLVGPNRKYDAELDHYKAVSKTVEYAELTTPPSEHAFTPQPRTISSNAAPQQWRDLTVDEAIQLALANSSVLRDLGGTVLRYPESTRTILGPAITSSDPRFGMEAALSAFDAQVASSVVAEKNDRQVNNFITSGGAPGRIFLQDLVNFQSQISKTGAAGTQLFLRGRTTYDANNANFNKFGSFWDSYAEAEFRQPLLQGAGTRFNRLAGPNAVPGFYNGVLIARTNTDISTAEFELAIRDLISNVENAYWDLYFAMRDLDARITARNAALNAWKSIAVMRMAQQAGGKPEREAQAREQYYRYEEEVQNALAGRLQDATTNNNGSSGGSFRGTGGVLVCERRLRLAIGQPITGEEMLRPVDEPTLARVEFDWATASDDAVARRPELHRQRLLVKRREMEYVASRNFLLPRFDLLGRYRWRGLGKGLIGDVNLPPGDPDVSFENSSLANLANGDFQEWQLGGEVSFPVGFRRGYAGVRNAQLLLAREKAVLEEQERQIVHDLSNAVADLDRAYEIMRTSYNRRMAALQNLELTRAAMAERPDVNPEQLLEAARRYSEADIQFQRALVEHMLAIKNVHFEKGTLLEYGRVQLSERVPPEALPPASPTANPPAPSAPPASVPPEGSSPLLPGGTPVPMSPPPATPPSLPPPAPAPAGGYAPPATPELTITVPPASAAAAPPVGVPPVVNLPDTYQPPQAIGARLPPREPTAAPAISTAMAPAAPIAAIPPREQSVLGTGHPPAMPREQSVLVPAYPAASATHAQPPAGTWPVPASVPGPVPQPATNWTAPPSVPASVPQPATNWSVPAPAPAPRPAAAESNRASPSTVPVAPTPGSPPAAAPPLKPTSLLPGGRLEWSREIRQAGFDSATSGQFAAPASYVAEAAVPPAGVALPAVAPASPENQLHRLPPVGAESENRSWRLPAP